MQELVDKLAEMLVKRGHTLVTAESCTGGFLAAAITHKPGASKMFERGFITYSNESKTDMLGVPKTMIDTHGAVSAEVAKAMAEGAIKNSRGNLALSITGVAGPDGGSEEKPVGLVYIGYAVKGGQSGSTENNFQGKRIEIQTQASFAALKLAIGIMEAGQ